VRTPLRRPAKNLPAATVAHTDLSTAVGARARVLYLLTMRSPTQIAAVFFECTALGRGTARGVGDELASRREMLGPRLIDGCNRYGTIVHQGAVQRVSQLHRWGLRAGLLNS
jgi:hypothetical protein